MVCRNKIEEFQSRWRKLKLSRVLENALYLCKLSSISEKTRIRKEMFFGQKSAEGFEKAKIEQAYKISHLEHVLESKDQQIRELEEAARSAQNQISTNKSSLLDEELRICDLEKSISGLTKKFEAQRQQLEEES